MNISDLNSLFDTKGNNKLEILLKRIKNHKKLQTYWICSNINSIDRMKRNDHGPTHILIVMKNALKLLRLLHNANIKTSIEVDFKENKNVPNYNLNYNDSEVVVILAAALHDIGISIHRYNHSLFSIPLALKIMDYFLKDIYNEPEKTIIESEVLHCIQTHSLSESSAFDKKRLKPFTIEASVLTIADALDMTKNRTKIPIRIGKDDIHSQSTLAIKKVEVGSSEEKPIHINIIMDSMVGLFQVEDLLKEKIGHTKLGGLIDLSYQIEGEDNLRFINL